MTILQTNGNGHLTGWLPQDIADRDDYVGVAVTSSGLLRLSVSRKQMKDIGASERVDIRGTPQNGYLISKGNDYKLQPAGSTRFYIYGNADRLSAPASERPTIWLRGTIDHNRIRVPFVPDEWIKNKLPVESEEPVRETRIDIEQQQQAVQQQVTQSAAYTVPEGLDIGETQALLARKLDEARAIMKELERRTGLKFTLTRNFAITLDLSR